MQELLRSFEGVLKWKQMLEWFNWDLLELNYPSVVKLQLVLYLVIWIELHAFLHFGAFSGWSSLKLYNLQIGKLDLLNFLKIKVSWLVEASMHKLWQMHDIWVQSQLKIQVSHL
jgi:hypothetical protein